MTLKDTTSICAVQPALAARRSPTGRWLHRFRQDRTGSMSYFAVAGALVMMVFGGIGIDMIHAEYKRTQIQNTLDRAVLSAANLENAGDPQQIVEDYFTAMGMQGVLTEIDIEQSAISRRVSAAGETSMPSNFMSLIGVETLAAAGNATAEHATANVEISMVLDVSGSMGWNNKIANLRDAADEFIDILLHEENTAETTISVVPYNATVNLGPTIAQHFTLDDLHDASNCVIFPESAFEQTAVSPAQTLTRLAHFDLRSSDEDATEIARPWCYTGETAAVIAHSADADALKAHVTSFTANGNTAIDLGMKWANALLDPAARPAIAGMAAEGIVDPQHAARPAAHSDTDTAKYVVVMTDGENTTQYDLKPQHKYGMSDIWIDDRGNADPGDDRFSLLVQDNPGDDTDLWFWERFENDGWSARNRATPDGGAAARRMTNPEVFARWGTRAVARKMYTQPYYDGFVSYDAYYDIFYAYEGIVGPDAADARLAANCDAAKNAGTVVFAIGFEAPPRGLDAMRNCASSPAHFFDVQGADLEEAFAAIANTISQLRLTQ